MISRTLAGVVLLSAVAATAQSQTKTERGLRLNADGSVRISNLVGSVHVNRLESRLGIASRNSSQGRPCVHGRRPAGNEDVRRAVE
jgi:hypothetical protein